MRHLLHRKSATLSNEANTPGHPFHLTAICLKSLTTDRATVMLMAAIKYTFSGQSSFAVEKRKMRDAR